MFVLKSVGLLKLFVFYIVTLTLTCCLGINKKGKIVIEK